MLPLPLAMLFRPGLTEINRLPARAPLTAHVSAGAAREGGEGPHRLSLDGTWAFQLASSPDAAPSGWTMASTDEPGWRTIRVPGAWTRQDTGDHPHYTNIVMPFACQYPPDVPERNPTGLYRTLFDLPEGWAGRRTILHIGGFESVALVWCNGVFAGMGKDSRLPSEFDLTGHVTERGNRLAIMVIRFSDASWIEDQDHWNHGGLHRSLHLESRGQVHVRDLKVVADLDPGTGKGAVRLRAEVEGPSKGWRVRASVETLGGDMVGRLPEAAVDQFRADGTRMEQVISSHMFHGYAAETALGELDVAPWSSERPVLYRLVTELLDPDGIVHEVHATLAGFRRVEVSGRRLKINGKPVVLIGVNRHDHHPHNGKTVSPEEMREELSVMKRHNINAIRTAHYPNDHRLLDLADELGLYVIDEANVECHARYHEVSNHPDYEGAIFERTRRMIARDRNHPSVIGWSTGNESGRAPVHSAAAAFARHMDPTRFVQYEGAVADRFVTLVSSAQTGVCEGPDAAERAMTDIVCPMYASVEAITGWARWAERTGADDRPLILCEYSHAMGNSNGSISDYVDAFFSEPALGGGFVWDWRDQGLAETDADGHFYWAYGGHFGDEPNDGNFNINGLVGPDGAPHPALREYMWAARPVAARHAGGRRVRLENRRVFEDTSDLQLHWTLQRDGRRVEAGVLDLEIAPGTAIEADIPYRLDCAAGSDWHLLLEWRTRAARSWAPAGLAVAWDQIRLKGPVREEALSPGFPARRTAAADRVSNGPASLYFDRAGGLQRIDLCGETVITGDVTATVWRAPTANAGGKPGVRDSLFPTRCRLWTEWGLNYLRQGPVSRFEDEADGAVRIGLERDWIGANGQRLTHRTVWLLLPDEARVHEEIVVPAAWDDIPRVGVRFEVPRRFARLSWLGPGPDESYPDRQGAQTFGMWETSVREQYHPYVRPQEHGAHTAARQFSLSDGAGGGFGILLPRPLSFSVREHHDADLNEAETLADLVTRDTLEVHIDAAMRGLGTGACGPDVLPQYKVRSGVHAFGWRLRPLRRTD